MTAIYKQDQINIRELLLSPSTGSASGSSSSGVDQAYVDQQDQILQTNIDGKLSLTGGTLSGTLNTLDISTNGNITATSNITAYSDKKLKKNIRKIDDALYKVNQLNGYTFDRIDIKDERQTGVIAQEVQTVLPEAVRIKNDTLTVAYGNIIGLLIEAIKELNEKIK